MQEKFRMIFERMFGDVFMTFETARLVLKTKKADMSMNEIVGLIVVLIALIAIGAGIYMKVRPNPDTVAGCFTETMKIGPFG